MLANADSVLVRLELLVKWGFKENPSFCFQSTAGPYALVTLSCNVVYILLLNKF